VTADALHTTAEHARYLHSRGADHVFTVKENQHRLHGLLDTLPWHEIPAHITSGSGHGRSERRTIQLAPLGKFLGYPAIDFPHATHAFLIERYTTHHTSRKRSAHAALGLTSLTGRYAHPAHIGGYVRSHWHIENKLHWVRDVTPPATPPEPSPCSEYPPDQHKDFAGAVPERVGDGQWRSQAGPASSASSRRMVPSISPYGRSAA
ncbi:transposase, partial [Amycolatopsis mediterranei]